MAAGSPALLPLPAKHAARVIALRLLEEADGAAGRLAEGSDPEALHDFRVALRRLRSLVRAYAEALDESVTPRLRRRLRDVARATGRSRDAEVHLAWLARERDAMPPEHRAGVNWLARRVERAQRRAAPGLGDATRDYARLRGKLAGRLAEYRTTVRLDGARVERAYGEEAAELLVEHADALGAQLRGVHSTADAEAAHEARIVGKRLRYLLEPLADEVAGARTLLKPLRALQDALGDLHDTHVFLQEIAGAAEAAGEEGDETHRAGLDALASALRGREAEAFAAVQTEWLGGAADTFLGGVRQLADMVAARAHGDVEIERKFLLRGLPPEASRAPAREIEQGYLPGERLVERLRRVRDGERLRHYRTVKLGEGVTRTEVEEETEAELFERLWPLTEGRRVTKRRYRARDGDLLWEVDEFLDRELVLAEVELPSESTPAEPPEWLRSYVVREVTGEPEYVNARLAR